jgi:hypothetical protein
VRFRAQSEACTPPCTDTPTGAPVAASVLLPSLLLTMATTCRDDEPSLLTPPACVDACACSPLFYSTNSTSCRDAAVARAARWLLATGPLAGSVSGIPMPAACKRVRCRPVVRGRRCYWRR